MTLPKWNDPKLKAGTMIRTALWLVGEVGVGNTFTKERHRQAFSGIAQADRRLRDLRDYGWVIHTNLEDVTLNSNEQRLVSVGSPVWERGVRKHTATETLTAKKRMGIFARNDYQCVVCGIAGGEIYPDAPHMTAVLSVSRRPIRQSGGNNVTMFVTECKRCRAGVESEVADIELLLSKISGLDSADRSVFIRWTKHGRRNSLEQLWGEYRRLSQEVQDEVNRRLLAKD